MFPNCQLILQVLFSFVLRLYPFQEEISLCVGHGDDFPNNTSIQVTQQ
jgi:hypothetical protein